MLAAATGAPDGGTVASAKADGAVVVVVALTAVGASVVAVAEASAATAGAPVTFVANAAEGEPVGTPDVVAAAGGQQTGPATSNMPEQVSPLSSAFILSTRRSAHVFPADPTAVVSATVMPSGHTGHGLTAGVGQQVSCASFMSWHPRLDADVVRASPRRPPHVLPSPIRSSSGAVIPSGQTRHDSKAVAFAVGDDVGIVALSAGGQHADSASWSWGQTSLVDSTRPASAISSSHVFPPDTSRPGFVAPPGQTWHGDAGAAGQQTSSVSFICAQVSLPSSTVSLSTTRSPHVFDDPSPTDDVDSTVMPPAHTSHGEDAAGGQQYSSARSI